MGCVPDNPRGKTHAVGEPTPVKITWLVVDEKYESVGKDYSQYIWKKHVPNHQPVTNHSHPLMICGILQDTPSCSLNQHLKVNRMVLTLDCVYRPNAWSDLVPVPTWPHGTGFHMFQWNKKGTSPTERELLTKNSLLVGAWANQAQHQFGIISQFSDRRCTNTWNTTNEPTNQPSNEPTNQPSRQANKQPTK